MKIEKIRTDSYSILKISKYDFLVKLIREIGNFPYVVSNIYEDNSTKTTIVEDQGMYIMAGMKPMKQHYIFLSVILIVKLEFIMVMKNFFLIF